MFELKFKNSHLIYEKQIKCLIKEKDFNFSYNKSLLNESGSYKYFVNTEYFEPYFTTIGLYNDEGDLLAVCKTAKAISKPRKTDLTILINLDV